MPEHQPVQFERMVQAPLVRSAGGTMVQRPAAPLGRQREEATCLRQAERGRQVATNLKELGYGG